MANKLSVYIITKDCEDTIRACLESVKWVDEIVIVDSGSKDNTIKIAKEYTSKIYIREWPGFRVQYQYAQDHTDNLWVFFIDSDEELSSELIDEIKSVMTQDEIPYDAFKIKRLNFFLGRWIRFGGWGSDEVIRLYRKDKGRWEGGGLGGLHALVKVKGRVGKLKHHILHYPYKDLSEQMKTIEDYSTTAALDMQDTSKSLAIFKMVFHPFFRFLKEYIFKQGFRDGIPGLIIAVMTMFYVFVKYAKVWEIKMGFKENSIIRVKDKNFDKKIKVK